jgi:hypothetical protein
MDDSSTTHENLEAALHYAQLGLPVFPCRIRDEGNKKAKSPYTPNGFHNASTQVEQIKCWWANHPDAIIGMPTGKASGLVVIDIDPRHGGDHSLQGLIDQHSPLPDTLTAMTGGGGTHYYFRYPNHEIRCSNSKLASGVDVKADGGYVILPPSGHESGKSYFWDGDFDLSTVADIPRWLLGLIEASGQPIKPAAFSEATLAEGQRNEMLTRWAGVLRYYGRGQEEVFASLQATNRLRCQPPLSESEVRAIAASVCRYEPDQAAVISLEGAPDVDVSGIASQPKPPDKPKLVTISLADVEAKELQWLWPNRLPAGMLSLLVGNPGVGKSFLTMFMCSQITTGRDWPDAENTIPPGSVLIFSDEESLEYAIKPRLVAHDADCSKIFAVEHIERPDGLSDSFGIKEHIQLLNEYLDQLEDCRLIIFDPITAYLGAVKANDNAEVRGALLGLQRLAQERNITVLGINHFSKKAELDTIHRVLGSMGFVAASRAVWGVVLEKPEDESQPHPARLLSPIKSNYSIDPTTLRYEIIDGKVVFTEGHSRANIDSIMHKVKKTNPNIEAAKTFLRQELTGTAFGYSKDILEKAKEMGISKNLIYKAKNEMGVFDWREGFGYQTKWSLEPQGD